MDRRTHRIRVALMACLLAVLLANAFAAVAGDLGWPPFHGAVVILAWCAGIALALRHGRDVLHLASAPPALSRRAWRWIAVVIVLSTGLVSLLLLMDTRHDTGCHYPITHSILRGNLPVRDLACPENYLAYHYGFDLLSAMVFRPLRALNASLHVEMALDVSSALVFAGFLFSILVFLLVLAAELAPVFRMRGRDIVAALVLVTFGGGLIVVIPWLGVRQVPWDHYWYGAFHPLLQYIGRRPTLLGQTVFVVLLTELLLLRHPARRNAPSLIALVLLHSLLALCAEELLVALVLLALLLLAHRDSRRAAAFFLLGTLAALPVIAMQGGMVTALLMNRAWSGEVAGLVLHAPRISGWFLREFNFSERNFWITLLLEAPPTIWLAAGALLLSRRNAAPGIRFLRALGVVAGAFLLLPLCVSFGHSASDAHRLFFLPQMLSFILLPVALHGLGLPERARPLALGVMAVLLAAGPAMYTKDFVDRTRKAQLLWRHLDVPRSVPARFLEPGSVWVVSQLDDYRSLVYHGVFVLAAPYGSYGALLFSISPQQHRQWTAKYLDDPAAFGATHGLLLEQDVQTLQSRGVPHRLVESRTGLHGEPIHVVQFPPREAAAFPTPRPGQTGQGF